MTSIPTFPIYFGVLVMFGVPIAIITIGVLVYFLNPNHREANGYALIGLGIFELVGYLSLITLGTLATGNLSIVPIVLCTLSILAIVIGIISLKRSKVKPTT